MDALWTVLLVSLRLTTYLRSRPSWHIGQFSRSFQQALCGDVGQKIYLPISFPSARTHFPWISENIPGSVHGFCYHCSAFQASTCAKSKSYIWFLRFGYPIGVRLHRGSDYCLATRSIQILAAAERYPAREGACGRLGGERDWLDDYFGMTIPQL